MNKDRGILDELRELSPTLLKLKEEGHRPFRVPDGYFNELKDNVFSYIDAGLAEGLGRSATSGLNVPEGYFENLSDDIMRKIEAEEIIEGGMVIDLQQVRKREAIPVRRWTVMAASVALFILLGVLAARFITLGGTDPAEMTADRITQDEAYEYLEENMTVLDSEYLLAMIDLGSENISLGVTDDLEEELNQYLEDNIDDLEDYLLTVEI